MRAKIHVVAPTRVTPIALPLRSSTLWTSGATLRVKWLPSVCVGLLDFRVSLPYVGLRAPWVPLASSALAAIVHRREPLPQSCQRAGPADPGMKSDMGNATRLHLVSGHPPTAPAPRPSGEVE